MKKTFADKQDIMPELYCKWKNILYESLANINDTEPSVTDKQNSLETPEANSGLHAVKSFLRKKISDEENVPSIQK